jgi:hypothetical protein
MRRRSFALGLSGLALASAPDALRAQAVEWEDIVSTEGQFRLQMPKGYKVVSGMRPSGRMTQYQIAFPSGFGLEFAVTDLKNENPLDPTLQEDHLHGGIEAMRQRWPGSTYLEREDVWLGSARGLAVVLSVQKNTGVLIVRAYVTVPRLYAQVVLARNDERENPVIDRFLNSLRIES